MSDEVQIMECGMCGQEAPTDPECPMCGGDNQRFLQPRSYTLSEERQGKNPNPNDRYSRTGDVSPKLVLLPGGAVPGKSN